MDLAIAREELQAKMPRAITDGEFASWLMYPKVFTDYMADRTHFGDTSVIPTRAFFYGLEPGEDPRIVYTPGYILSQDRLYPIQV